MEGGQVVGENQTISSDKKLSEESKTNQPLPATDEQIEQELINQLDYLFNLDNLKNNRYLIQHANINFEIPLNTIYEERKIKQISANKELVLQALKKVDKVEVLKSGFVKPKYEPKRDKIIIKRVIPADEVKFNQFLAQIPEYKEAVPENYTPKYDNRLQTVTLECKDNTTAKSLFNALNKLKFHDASIDSLLNEENFYISCLENIKRYSGPNYSQPQTSPYVKYNQPQYPPQYNNPYMFAGYNPYYNQMYQQNAYPSYPVSSGGYQQRQNYNSNQYYQKRYNAPTTNTYNNDASNTYNNNNKYGGGKRNYYNKEGGSRNYPQATTNTRYTGQKNPKELNFDQQNFPPLSDKTDQQ
jgi:hypothetical protein